MAPALKDVIGDIQLIPFQPREVAFPNSIRARFSARPGALRQIAGGSKGFRDAIEAEFLARGVEPAGIMQGVERSQAEAVETVDVYFDVAKIDAAFECLKGFLTENRAQSR